MRVLLNSLYITKPDAYVSKDGLDIVVSVCQEEAFRIPVHNIEQIVMFGYAGASPGAMKLCADNNVSLVFLSPNGRYIGRFIGKTRGNVLLRKSQCKISEDCNTSLHLSILFTSGKIQNYRNILCRALRDNGENLELKNAAHKLERCKRRVLQSESIDIVRGIEGEAASCYFSVFSHLVLHQREDFNFSGRNRRPPKDAVNAMLSFVYTLICNDVTAALDTVGLDPYIGFMHTLRPGRASLALDLMEELRAYLGDRLVLSLINKKQIRAGDFISQGEQGVVMNDNARKTIISAWQNRKKDNIIHPYLGEKVCIGLLPYIQSTLLARFIRHELDDYPVFLIK